MSEVSLIRTDSNNTDFQKLVVLLDKDLAIRDGADHSFYSQYNKIDLIRQVVVVYKNGISVACGAIKPFSETATEVKRMFVHPEFRKQGFAARILTELEQWAAELGYYECVLETGKKQPEAISLYQKVGYNIITNYGQYLGVENSVCMAKTITNLDT